MRMSSVSVMIDAAINRAIIDYKLRCDELSWTTGITRWCLEDPSGVAAVQNYPPRNCILRVIVVSMDSVTACLSSDS